MGKAIAEEGVNRGYSVEFISGPVAKQNLPDTCNLHCVTSASDMLAKAEELFPSANVAIFAAAVADYAPTEKLPEKMAKSTDDLVLRLRPTPDIAKILCANKQSGQTAIGFALQTSEGEANARRKLESKNLDGIVLNTPATLGAADGTFSFLAAGAGHFKEWGLVDKTECAKRIFEQVERLIRGK